MELRKLDINGNSKTSILIFVLISIIATPIHEFGHFLGYSLSGIPANYTFNYTESTNGSESLYAILGGPLIGLLLALLGCIIVYILKEKKYIFVVVYFTITMCLTRLVPYLLFTIISPKGMFPINDEGLIADFLNVPLWYVYFLSTIIFISILLFIKLRYKDYFYKCFKYAFLLYFAISVLFGIKIY